MAYTRAFEEALLFASERHRHQTRKGIPVPYIHHLLAVTALVGEHGGTETEVIAALLHDAPEDQGGHACLQEIITRFGPEVGQIVEGCTDTFEMPKPPWKPRKEAYLAHLSHADTSTLLVSAADKLHNARSLESDVRSEGNATLARFHGGKDGTLWYYRELRRILSARVAAIDHPGLHRLVDELTRAIDRFEQAVARNTLESQDGPG
jgi:(p)ppGpp synthase/HD superfamily hydrolase